MTKALASIRARLAAATSGAGARQTSESLIALANDVGLITNPSLRIAASVATECLQSRTDIARLIAAVEVAERALASISEREYDANVDDAREARAEIEKVLGE